MAFAKLNRDLLARKSLLPCACAYALLPEDPTSTAVEVACAGIPRPFLIRDGQATEVGEYNTLLGVCTTAFPSDPAVVSVGRGVVLVLYTDGVTEARGVDGFSGAQRLMTTVGSVEQPCAEAVTAALLTDVETFQHGRLRDDIAILVIEATP